MLSKSSHALKFRLTARTGFKGWQTLTLGTKLATRATKWEIRGSAFQVFGQVAEFWSCENIRIVLLLFYYFYSSSGIKYSATEFIQNLLPVGRGPSSNTCPRCEPQVSRTSILS